MDTISQFLGELMENILLFINELSALDTETWMRLGFLYVVFLWCAIVIWAIRDVSLRGGGFFWQLLAILLIIFLTPIFGLPLYLLIRPQQQYSDAGETYEENWHEAPCACAEENTLVCFACEKPIDEEFTFCPYCAKCVKEPCAHCQKIVRSEWKICPYCGTRDFHEAEKKEEKKHEEKHEKEKVKKEEV